MKNCRFNKFPLSILFYEYKKKINFILITITINKKLINNLIFFLKKNKMDILIKIKFSYIRSGVKK